MRTLLRVVRNPSFFRFLVIGGAGFVITMGINYGLKFFVMPDQPVTALAIGTIVATVFSYWMNKTWSFENRGDHSTWREILLFTVVSLVGIGLNSLPLYVSRYLFNLEEPYVTVVTQEVADFVSGAILGTVIAMAFRYWAMNRFVFPAAAAAAVTKTKPSTVPVTTASVATVPVID